MAKRVKKYLLFMFGNWKSVEENQQVVSNIREVMETIIVGDEFSFVTGDNVINIFINYIYLGILVRIVLDFQSLHL